MNSQLRLKLIQCDLLDVAETTRKPSLPPLTLLGHGLDAIIQHTRPKAFLAKGGHAPKAPSDQERMDRYQVAATLFPLYADPEAARMRVYIGELRRSAWELGDFRKVGIARLQLQMRSLAVAAAAASTVPTTAKG